MSPPTLLMLPGLDGTGHTTDWFVECLGVRVRPVRLTYPNDRYRSRAELAQLILDDWPSEGPVVVLGESYSAAVAVAVGAARPPGLAGLVLVTPSFVAPPRQLLRFLAPFLPPLRPPPAILRWLLLNDLMAAADLLSIAVACTPSRVLRARLREYLADPSADDPFSVSVPILALLARRDRLLRPAKLQFRPGIEWISFDSPHLVLAAVPLEAADAVAKFVNRVVSVD